MTSLRYVSHDVVLEPGRWQVRVGQDILTPEPKVFELLSYLMRHPGRVVPKAELLDALWAGDVVGESVLTRCVSCARKLLADDSKTPRFIRTCHGRGYEFIAPVAALSAPAPDIRSVVERASSGDPSADEPPAGQRPFIGRTAEALQISMALRRLESREPGFVLVSGEAGIGKTRLLERAAENAPPPVEVHAARCSAIEGAPAFFVWQQFFRSIIKTRSIKVVRRAFDDAPSGARKLLLGMDGWRVEDRLGWDSSSERFRTFDSIVRGLFRLAEQRPLALLLDDLHAADLVSLLLLEFLIQQPAAPILVLAAVRDTQQLSLDAPRYEALSRIRAACRSEIALSGFSRDEVGQFVQQRFEQAPDALLASLLVRTGGNPFFLSVLTASHDFAKVGESPLPIAIRRATSERLAALETDCVSLLRVAAVCGQAFDGLVLARAAGIPAEKCFGLLSRACAARVVANAGERNYHFNHDLIREVLYEELDESQKPLLHLAVGRALQALQAYQDARHAALLAHHFVEAAHVGGASNALDLSICAGAYALRNFAYEAAIDHFTRASRLLTLSAEVDPATECAVLLDLGLSQISAGRRDAGQHTLQAAADKARAIGGVTELATVALHLAPGLFSIETGVYDPMLVGLLREALDQAGHHDPKLRALLLARLALALYWSDTFDERTMLCDEARTLAESVGTDDVRAAVGSARLFALLRPSNLDERRALSDQALELSQRVGDRDALLINRLMRAAMAMESGDFAGQSFEADAFRTLAEETNQPQALWIVKAQRACRLLLQGQLDETEGLAGACLATGQRVQDHNALLTFGVHLTLVRIEQARGAEVLDVIRDYAARYPRIIGWRVLYAYALSRSGQTNACAIEYESLQATGFALPDDLNWMVSMAWLAEICHARGDARGATMLYQRLAPFAARFVVIGYGGIACLGSVERYLALLAATLGRTAEAKQHFEGALLANRAAPATLPLAHTLCDYAAWLRGTGFSAEAQDLLREAAPLIQQRNLIDLSRRHSEC